MNLDSYSFVFVLLAGFAALGAAIIGIVEKGRFFRRSEDRQADWLNDLVRTMSGSLPSVSGRVAANFLWELKGSPELVRAPEGAWYLILESSFPNRPPTLTPSEESILQLISMGKPNNEIAEALSISPDIVRMHVERILAKVGAAAAARQAIAVRDPQVSEALDDAVERLKGSGGSPLE